MTNSEDKLSIDSDGELHLDSEDRIVIDLSDLDEEDKIVIKMYIMTMFNDQISKISKEFEICKSRGYNKISDITTSLDSMSKIKDKLKQTVDNICKEMNISMEEFNIILQN